jgi:hypothetical protein
MFVLPAAAAAAAAVFCKLVRTVNNFYFSKQK